MRTIGWSAFVLLFLFLPGIHLGPVSGSALAEEKQGNAGTSSQPAELWSGESGVMSPPSSGATVSVPLVSDEKRETGRNKAREQYLALFGGPVSAGDTTATYNTSGFLFSGPTTTTANIRFNNASVIGVRWGIWGGDTYPYLGFAMELGTFQADGVSDGTAAVPAKVDYISFTLMPMVRARFFRTESMPNGHVNIYGGIAFSFVPSGSVSTSAFNADLKGNGMGGLAGVLLRYASLDLFGEARSMSMNLDVDQLFSSGDLSMNTKETVFGVALRF